MNRSTRVQRYVVLSQKEWNFAGATSPLRAYRRLSFVGSATPDFHRGTLALSYVQF